MDFGLLLNLFEPEADLDQHLDFSEPQPAELRRARLDIPVSF